MSICHCGSSRGWINGSTLLQNLAGKSRKHPFGKIDKKGRIAICPSCHEQWLGIDEDHSLPFQDADGLMRTIADPKHPAPAHLIDFVGFRFTLSALLAARALQAREFVTVEMEERGKRLPPLLTAVQAAEFSRQVCLWGRGARVWGKLTALSDNKPGPRLARWLNAVKAGELTDEAAISEGIGIPGLGVSFASKHLRMLQPSRYAVLDDVLCKGFGFALNKKGFAFFLRELRKLQAELDLRFAHAWDVATLEAGMFMLVRQGVRAREEQDAD